MPSSGPEIFIEQKYWEVVNQLIISTESLGKVEERSGWWRAGDALNLEAGLGGGVDAMPVRSDSV